MLQIEHILFEVSSLSLDTFFVEPWSDETHDDCLADEGTSQINENANVDPGSKIFEFLWNEVGIRQELFFSHWNFHSHHVERDWDCRVIWGEHNRSVKCKYGKDA